VPERAAGGRALFIGKGLLGLGIAQTDTLPPTYSLEAFHDDPVRGVVRFLPAPIPLAGLSPLRISEQRPGAGTLAIVDGIWTAFTFGTCCYDPFGSLGESLSRAADTAPAPTGDEGGGWKASLATALWAAMEGDLYRFAFDLPFIRELEAQKDSDEWRRFARLNDLYRACIRAIVPFGIAPAAWNDWISASGQTTGKQSGYRRALERVLARPVDAIAGIFAAKTFPEGVFSVPPLDRVES
jgi:hypothetical protein